MGVKITDAALLNSVKVMNEGRALLHDLYELRKAAAPPVTGAEVMEVLNASFRMPKELFNQWLRETSTSLRNRARRTSRAARIMSSAAS